ncbi:hypothetical protein Tcan_15488, partial [Toxocara canis]
FVGFGAVAAVRVSSLSSVVVKALSYLCRCLCPHRTALSCMHERAAVMRNDQQLKVLLIIIAIESVECMVLSQADMRLLGMVRRNRLNFSTLMNRSRDLLQQCRPSHSKQTRKCSQ